MKKFNRKDIVSAYSLLVYDYELYTLRPRIRKLGFRISDLPEHYNSLTENAQTIYDEQKSKLLAEVK